MNESAKLIREKAERAWQRYQSRRLAPEFEPEWIQPDYQRLQDWLDGKTANESAVREILDSFDVPDGSVQQSLVGKVVIEDGFLVGTTSWIFDRRNECDLEIYREWIILSRALNPAIVAAVRGLEFPAMGRFWMAFLRHPEKRFRGHLPGIGPCMSLEEMHALIDLQEDFNC